MKDRLQNLIEGNNETNRAIWANQWKKQGKKVIGIMSGYVPEEIVSAAGILPWRITGTWRENIHQALVYRPETSNGYCNRVLESLLNGELDFLDGIILTDIDHELFRLWDVMKFLKKPGYCYIMHIPFMDNKYAIQFTVNEINKLVTSLENFSGEKITETALYSSIETYNKMRSLLGRLYELRKREIPPLSGAEILGITTAAQIMPRDKFNHELEVLLPYIQNLKTNLKNVHPRILLESDMLDNPAYLKLVEENCLVAMDDMDTGCRYFMKLVDTVVYDPIFALAQRYLTRHGGPVMKDWDKQLEQIIKWVGEYTIDGVLSLTLRWDYPQQYRIPIFKQMLDESGIPNANFERDYHLSNMGQLRTRIGAFLEMLDTKKVVHPMK